MESLEPAPTRAAAAARAALRVRAASNALARRLAASPPYRVVFPLAVLQWLLAGILAVRVGHEGSLALVVPQVAVLLPLALVIVYEIALRLGGRLFAAWAAAVWVVLPYAGLAYATPSLRHLYAHRFLLHLVGLADDPRFAALVAFAAAAYFTLRALEGSAAIHIGASVVAAAAGSALAPREALVAVAPAVALAVGGRRRQALAATIGLAVLLGGVGAAVGAGLLDGPFGQLGFTNPGNALASLRENFWSGRVLEWLAVAGIAGALRGRIVTGAILTVSFVAAFLSIEGPAAPAARNLALLQGLLPAWFAFALLVASIPLLLPRARTAGTPATVAVRRFWDRIHVPTFAPRAADDVYERPVATPLWASVSIGVLFLLMLVVGMWNATRAHAYGGYDAQEHIDYAYNLIHHGQIPSRAAGGEFYTPPGFYAIAGVALWIGQLIGTFEPPHMALYLNAIYVLGTGALLLTLARLLFPRRPTVWVAALGFFACLPVVAKSAGMFYPETLNMLVSTAAVTLAAWMLIRRRLGLRWLLLLGAVLGAGQLVRSSAVFTFGALGAAFIAAVTTRRFREQMPLRTIALAIAVVVVVTSPWYVRQAVKYHTIPLVAVSGYFDRMLHPRGEFGGVKLPFFKLSPDDVFNRPVRPFYINEALPVMYTEIWGDWSGYWAWSGYSEGPSPEALVVLKDQTKIGILPTLLAIGGWLMLWGIAVRRRAEGIPLIPLLLLPLLAVGAVFWRAYATPTPEGNLLKASYALTTAPVWALGFGVAVDWLSRRRLIGLGLAAALVVLGILTLRFNMYGVRDHFTIF
jgi:4-amino-4-deoxy-L-arabinose transferase-like glycosyltransferase